MKRYRADLHVHTCLSPCGHLDMSPANIVRSARNRGIDILAICDHNSCENGAAVIRTAAGIPLRVLPGLEVTSREEVHILALFEKLEDALAMQAVVYANLPDRADEEPLGLQVVVNEVSEVLGLNDRPLLDATTLTIDQVVEYVHRNAGLAVAAHIDRQSFGIIGQLGFIPENIALDALAVSYRLTLPEAFRKFDKYSRYAFISASDAHHPEHIGRATTTFLLQEPSLSEIARALRGEAGRKILH
jgi:predicted metal-dependent phosphoesterase TrpH